MNLYVYKAGRVEVNTDEMNIDAPMSPFMKYFINTQYTSLLPHLS